MRAMEPEERFERIERQLEFLAASQAQHDARMAEISRVQADNSRQIAENSRQIDENSRQIAENSRQITGNTEHIGQLADLTLRIGRIVEAQATRIDALTGRMDELAISQVRTDKRLNTLIQVAERYFSNGH